MPKHKETTDAPDAQERTAACLFTDYSPNPLKVGINEESMEKINGSVVVVTEDDDDQKGTPSYGIVLWGNNENLDCTAHDKDNNVFRTNPEDPGICSEDDGTTTFETDERLNLLSLSVLGLRIIFFKGIAFNVLLTFHVYSRRGLCVKKLLISQSDHNHSFSFCFFQFGNETENKEHIQETVEYISQLAPVPSSYNLTANMEKDIDVLLDQNTQHLVHFTHQLE
ncbi:hypothetical protein JRQ81_004368 [Phrynocephalus forsythii]|uniref:T-cell receptor alpha chain constant domain-containing protein n=1 Tax=Phrynocephalus forsythii TaxID=171643 RepID=A0A9Q0XFT8_9SAUR|nr:hypothetical protein JRQ81_004368 [Phrynocephalus forsythii]